MYRNQEEEIKITLMHQMWARARKYQSLIDSGYKHYRAFGFKRFLFFFKFGAIRKRLAKYEDSRYVYVTMALGLSRQLNAMRREERKRRLDH